MSDRWTFYDQWAALPFTRFDEHDRNVIGEFMVGLDSEDGGSHGEFRISFYRFGNGHYDRDERIAARLESFGDSWRVLNEGGLVPALAELDGKPQGPDEIRALLLSLGYHDRTAELRGTHPAHCTRCGGSGVLDDVAPSDRLGSVG